MKESDVAMMKTKIIALIEQFNQSNAYYEDETKPIEPSVALGRLTRMEAIQEKSINEEVHRKNKQRLEALRNALARIEQGTYGVCSRCKKDISLGRLDFMPEALICIECANKKKP